METYIYRARGRDGEILSDSMEARDLEAVAERLKEAGLLVIHVERRAEKRRGLLEGSGVFERGISASDIVVFTRQLATMIEAGIPLVRSLDVLGRQSESEKFGALIGAVRRDIEGGSSFSEALRRREAIFGRLYVEMVRAGEYGGALDTVLLRIATQLEKEQALRRQVRSALTYPVFVLAAALLASVFMLVFVVPVFVGMYDDLGGELPLPTRIAVFLSDAATGIFGVFALCGLLVGGMVFRRWCVSEAGRRWVGSHILKLPFGFGKLAKKISLARSTRTFGSLVSTGVPVLQAMEITAFVAGNSTIEAAFSRSRTAVERGERINAALASEPIFPHLLVRMVAVGEESGNLDGMLAKVADFYEAEVDAAVDSLTTMLEPVLILVVGGIVGATIVAMYLPMFRVFELIQ